MDYLIERLKCDFRALLQLLLIENSGLEDKEKNSMLLLRTSENY